MQKEKLEMLHENVLEKFGLDRKRLTGMFLVHYEKGEFISRQGQKLEQLLIVLKGEAKVFCDVESGRRLLLSFYRAGGLIGEIEIMTHMEGASASVQALTGFSCIAIPVLKDNLDYLRNNLEFLNIVAENLAHKLERSSKNGAHIILYPLEERLCSYIDLVNVNGVFEEKMTEVAEVIGTSYRHLLREMERLVKAGILKKNGKKYEILQMNELKKRSRDFYRPVEKLERLEGR